jgi:cytoskeletal protein CcmA (bactofilin family)
MKNDDNLTGPKPVGRTEPKETAGPAAVVPYAPGQVWVEERTRVAVGRGATISGRLIFHEPVRIEGYFRGEVIATDLVVIAQEGSVQGKIRAPRTLILGELRGDINECERVVLGPRARVYGRVETSALTICEGAYLDADVRMPKASLERAKQSDSA